MLLEILLTGCPLTLANAVDCWIAPATKAALRPPLVHPRNASPANTDNVCTRLPDTLSSCCPPPPPPQMLSAPPCG
jgi:hypothetical protein